jgi:DNA (cytosine-5)-methyltransferase 1
MPRSTTIAKRQELTAVDLFAGGGGLTVGLKSAGFEVASAVELDLPAAETYAANHADVDLLIRDIRQVRGDELCAEPGGIDLVAGCPPCQGFTSLTSKYRRDDRRNALIEEMGRIVRELRPRAVMMENVPGLALKGRDRLDKFISELEANGYLVEWGILQVADYGTPQFRRRLVLFAGLGFSIKIPPRSHAQKPTDDLLPWRTTGEIIRNLPSPKVFSKSLLPTGGTVEDWHVVRRLSQANIERLRWAKPGGSWRDIPAEHRVACHQGEYNGFSNVYGRMAWDATPPTMTGGCTTLSKGRFGHPEEGRTISVREAALFQEFPDDYYISTPYMDAACNIVGNALPCGFAAVIARQVRNALEGQPNRAQMGQ